MRLSELVKEVLAYNKKADVALIRKAYVLAEKAHKGQMREGGEEFFSHPIEVAKILIGMKADSASICAALLHDTVEDCDSVSISNIYEQFGPVVGFLVDSLNKHEQSFHKFPKIVFEDKIERLLWAGLKDIRVLLIKLADREHNLETLVHLKEKKQVRMAFETQAIFEPLKKMLKYDSPLSLEKTQKRLNSILKRNNISSSAQFKQYLFDKSFKNY